MDGREEMGCGWEGGDGLQMGGRWIVDGREEMGCRWEGGDGFYV